MGTNKYIRYGTHVGLVLTWLTCLYSCTPHTHFVRSPTGTSELRNERIFLILPDSLQAVASSMSLEVFCPQGFKHFKLRLHPARKRRDTGIHFFLKWRGRYYPLEYTPALHPTYNSDTSIAASGGYATRVRVSDRKIHSDSGWKDAAIVVEYDGRRYQRMLSKPKDRYTSQNGHG